MTTRDLTALFDPKSVAVLGASNDETKYGNWMSVQALRMTGTRPVYLINRRGDSVLGQPPLRSLAEVDGAVDLVAITVPAHSFEAAVEDALAAGARAIVGVTAGFAELGPEGRALQDRVVDRVRSAGAVLLGPNCLGVIDSTTNLTFASNPLPGGRVALLSQSGNMALEVSGFLQSRGHGFSRFASLGNQADLGVADLIDSCVAHDGTDLIALYCEDFGDGRSFVSAAAAAAAANKPVLLLTVGGSEASVRGAQSHTGALTSDSAVIDAACHAAGIYRVTSPRQLADVAATLLTYGRRRVHRVAVIADGGGHAGVGSDVVEANGLSVPRFPTALSTALRPLLPPSAGVTNPVDIAGGGEQDIGCFASVLDAVMSSAEIDSVLLTGYFGGYAEYGEGLARDELDVAARIATIAQTHQKPLVVHTMHSVSKAARVLIDAGVPVFAAVDDAAGALAVIDRGTDPRPLPSLPGTAEKPLSSTDYWDARELFRAAGVTFPEAKLVSDAAQARAAAESLGYPVVVKAMGLLHKSDVGGVALGLSDPHAVAEAVEGMRHRLNPPGFCVEAMADLNSGVEIIVGVQRDPRFGPVAMVGLGGVYTEVLADVAFALAPVDSGAARALLESLRASALFTGLRGRAPVDLDAAARAIAAITEVAVTHPEITELEINPLLLTPDHALGLDARIVLDNQPTH
ncbi:acetate--CoA ligase family protein [Mycolicibacterium goodii]|uniref:Acetate--CoA ligase family protein n=1 Tax=Mycolicibacterium goodii TaxID=134601 RepID=A0ABS6HMG1_MYCGD|nr:acetate--CoA ligase family protein [Mycolicibacterium goodii]MBU8811407.1 acetate--CoA ligase family protein [Mycolicibacterium goodii]MBU8823844.1 acetate--CoA ligase family protein [Mycolicibacterium goodii]MBU8836489.1 acetate--CoA ligase family protein [Mycolicibacterium goodii]